MDFEIHLRSLRCHKGVKGQIYKDAPIELKFQYNDPYDILSILKIFCNSFEVIKGSQSGQRSNFQKCSDFAEIYNNDPYDILSILKLFKAAARYFSQILWIKKSTQSHLGSQGSSHNFGTILAYQIEHGQLLDGRRH